MMNVQSSIVFIDYQINELMVYLRNDFLDNFFLFMTQLGSWQIITLLLIAISVLFFFYKKKNFILPFFVAILGSGIMTVLLKYFVNRARPETDTAIYIEKLSSFPSAHAALIVALFGFLVFAFCKFKFRLHSKIIYTLFFILLIILIGFSRLYLGVHFVSDVIAGYLVGLLWVLISIHVFRKNYLIFKK